MRLMHIIAEHIEHQLLSLLPLLIIGQLPPPVLLLQLSLLLFALLRSLFRGCALAHIKLYDLC